MGVRRKLTWGEGDTHKTGQRRCEETSWALNRAQGLIACEKSGERKKWDLIQRDLSSSPEGILNYPSPIDNGLKDRIATSQEVASRLAAV
jgi:hypothetical protein